MLALAACAAAEATIKLIRSMRKSQTGSYVNHIC